MNIERKIVNKNIPLKYFYCTLENSEFILMGNDKGEIYSTEKKTNIGNILVTILENEEILIELLKKYSKIIENEDSINEDLYILYLQDLQQELNKICYYFKFANIARDISQKYFDTFDKFNMKNLKKNKCIIPINIKSFILSELNSYMENFLISLLSILLYCKKNNEDFSINEITFTENEDFIAYNYNLLCENSKFINYIKGVYEINNKIVTDEELKNIVDKNIYFIHIYQFNNIIDLLSLAFISVIDKKVNINICKNCKKVFITKNRTDEVYCNRVSPQNSKKTCKEYGAKRTYREQQKERPIDKAHIQTSQFLRMRYIRSKDEKQAKIYKHKLDSYLLNYKEKREQYKSNKLNEMDFVEWIKAQKNIK